MLSPVSRNRTVVVVGVVVVAAVVAAIAIVVAGGNGSGSGAAPPATTQTTAGTAVAGPVDVLRGVPQSGDTLGKATAPTTLEVFEDPQCPFCRDWALETFPTVVQQYVRTGRIRLVYRGVEIIGPNSVPALRAIYAAGRQDKLWNLVEELYTRQGPENSGWITPTVLRSAATKVGADAARVLAAADTAGVTSQLKQAAADFDAIGAPGTPTFVVEHAPALPQQLQLTGLDPATFTAALDAALP